MDSARRVVLLVLASSLLLPSCMPDLNALSSGTSSAGGQAAGLSGAAASPATAGNSSGGADAAGGLNAGSGGLRFDSDAGAAAGVGPEGGSGDVGGGAGMGVGGGAGGGGGMGDGGGMGGAANCPVPSIGATIYNTFDHDLLGAGFIAPASALNMDTMHAATGSSAWDAAVGASCPGALHYSFGFTEYVSGPPEEAGSGVYYFSNMDWSRASALHVMVKVSPVNAPISDVRLFVISGGSQYLFSSVTDSTKFKTGGWNEMILQLTGANYVATDVSQLGVQAVLVHSGTADIPTVPPTVSIWLDDIWLEPN